MHFEVINCLFIDQKSPSQVCMGDDPLILSLTIQIPSCFNHCVAASIVFFCTFSCLVPGTFPQVGDISPVARGITDAGPRHITPAQSRVQRGLPDCTGFLGVSLRIPSRSCVGPTQRNWELRIVMMKMDSALSVVLSYFFKNFWNDQIPERLIVNRFGIL